MWAHLDPVWAHFLIFLSFGPSLGSFWEKVHGFRTLDLIWAHYGLITGSLWAHFWSFHEPIMSPRQIQPVGSFWAHFLSPRCAHYGSKMSPWAHLGSWWAHLGLIALYRHFACVVQKTYLIEFNLVTSPLPTSRRYGFNEITYLLIANSLSMRHRLHQLLCIIHVHGLHQNTLWKS